MEEVRGRQIHPPGAWIRGFRVGIACLVFCPGDLHALRHKVSADFGMRQRGGEARVGGGGQKLVKNVKNNVHSLDYSFFKTNNMFKKSL